MARYFFDSMSRFLPMTSLVTSFCNISLNWPLNHLFEQLDLIFTKCIWRVKLLNVTWRTFWQNIYLIPRRVFELWRHLLTSFCSISLIFPLDRLFEQLNLIFTKYLLEVKLFSITRGRFWQDIFLVACLVFDLWCISDVVLQYFSNLTA